VRTGDVTSGQIVVGTGNTVLHQGASAGVPAVDPVRGELVRALAQVRHELVRLRAQNPGAVLDEDAADAVRALDEAESEAARAEPRPGRLRRRIHVITDALGEAAALSAAVVALQSAFDALISVG
jgi:hypothetical protein